MYRLVIIAVVASVFAEAADPVLLHTAKAEIHAAQDYSSLGILLLKQYRLLDGSLQVEITGNLRSIYPERMHGFHVHSNASSPDAKCSALGSHYNPLGSEHGAPSNPITNRHVGDLGNVQSGEDGTVAVNIKDSTIQVGTGNATFDIAGKSIAIHIETDDLGLGGANASNTTGNAGTIIACGSIVLIKDPVLLHTARVQIHLADNFAGDSIGQLTLKQFQDDDGSLRVEVTGNLKSVFPKLLHGFHIHANAPTPDTKCTALSSHYNPLSSEHGAPNNTVWTRHVGDLGNIQSDDNGTVSVVINDNVIQVGTGNTTFDIANRAIAIHIGTDDLGLGGTNASKTTGNAGTIMACGAIVLDDVSTTTASTPTAAQTSTIAVITSPKSGGNRAFEAIRYYSLSIAAISIAIFTSRSQ